MFVQSVFSELQLKLWSVKFNIQHDVVCTSQENSLCRLGKSASNCEVR